LVATKLVLYLINLPYQSKLFVMEKRIGEQWINWTFFHRSTRSGWQLVRNFRVRTKTRWLLGGWKGAIRALQHLSSIMHVQFPTLMDWVL
jgi:hypothetical protein